MGISSVIVQRPFESDIFRRIFEPSRIVQKEKIKVINIENYVLRSLKKTPPNHPIPLLRLI